MVRKPTYEELEHRVKELEEVEAEHQRAESMINITLERLNKAERIGNFGYWMQDLETGEEWWSKNEYMIHGLQESVKPSYDLHLNCVHPDDREDHDRRFKEEWESDRENFTLEYRILKRDGEVRNILARYHIERDTKGRPLRAAGTDQDTTERKRMEEELNKSKEELEIKVNERTAELSLTVELLQNEIKERKQTEEALRESEENLHTFIETTPNVILGIRPDYSIFEFNPEAEKLYGRKREEVLGKNYIEEFLPEDAREDVITDIKKVLSGKPSRGFINAVTSVDGSERILEWNVNPIFDSKNNPIGIIPIGNDITDREQANEELEYRFNFENIITTISTRFINLAPKNISEGINEGGVNPIDCTECDRVLDMINTPRGWKGTCHEIQKVHSGI